MPILADDPVVVPPQPSVTYNYIGFSKINISWPDPNREPSAECVYNYFGFNSNINAMEWSSLPNQTLLIPNLFTASGTDPVIAGAMQLIFFDLENRVKNLSRTTDNLGMAIMGMLGELNNITSPSSSSSSSS